MVVEILETMTVVEFNPFFLLLRDNQPYRVPNDPHAMILPTIFEALGCKRTKYTHVRLSILATMITTSLTS